MSASVARESNATFWTECADLRKVKREVVETERLVLKKGTGQVSARTKVVFFFLHLQATRVNLL